MIYLMKKEKSVNSVNNEKCIATDNALLIPLYTENIVAICPQCGKIEKVDIDIIKSALNDDNNGELDGLMVYCTECSTKRHINNLKGSL